MPVGFGIACFLSLSFLASASVSAEPATKVVDGGFYQPQFSPDGKSLLVTGQRMHGLSEVSVADGTSKLLLDEARIGAKAHYTDDGRVAFRAKRAGSMRALVRNASGTVEERTETPEAAFVHRDHIYMRTPVGVHRLSSGDRFFAPTISPDGTKVAYTGLSTGIHIYNLETGAKTHLGPGTAPSWSPDSQSLAYERTEDDGHNIVASDIWLWTQAEGRRALTTTDQRHERHPAWSPDGKRIAFDDDRGAIFVRSAGVVR